VAGRISFTFDDGMRSTYTNVFPLLRDAGLRGHIAVVTDIVGNEGRYTWDEIAAMAAGGWEVMSHSRTHDFTVMDDAKMRAEVVESKAILNARGYPAMVFNMPGGPWSGEPRFAVGSPFDNLVRATYRAYLPDAGVTRLGARPDPYTLGHFCCECYGILKYELPLEKVLAEVEAAAREGHWINLLWHDVAGPYVDKFKAVLAAVVPHARAGILLNVTVSDALGL